MKTLVLLGILALLSNSIPVVAAAEDSEAIQQRMVTIEQALQEMAEISTKGAQTVKRLSENVEKLANDYTAFKSEISQRLMVIEGELEKLRLAQKKPLATTSPKQQKNKVVERKYPPYPWEVNAPHQQKVTERTPIEKTTDKPVDIIYVREVYPSPVDRALPLSNEQMNRRPSSVYWILGLLGFASYFIVSTSSF